jgi:hypothetical protein
VANYYLPWLGVKGRSVWGLKQGAIALVGFLEQLHTFQGFASERLIENLQAKKEFSVAPSYFVFNAGC